MGAAGRQLLFQAKEGKACGAPGRLGGDKTGQIALLSVWPFPSYHMCCLRALLQPPCKVGFGETCPEAVPCHVPLFAGVPVFGCPWVLGTGGTLSIAQLELCSFSSWSLKTATST